MTSGRTGGSGPALATIASIAAILSLAVALAAWLWPKAPSGGAPPNPPAARSTTSASRAIDLTGTWVGPLTGFTVPLQYKLTLAQKAGRVSGTARGDGFSPIDGSAVYVIFSIDGQFDQATFTFREASVVESNPPGAQNWCPITATLTYAPARKLSGGWHALPSSNPNCPPQSGQLALQQG